MIVALKFPCFFTIRIIHAVPSQTNQQPATDILNKPKIKCTENNDDDKSQNI